MFLGKSGGSGPEKPDKTAEGWHFYGDKQLWSANKSRYMYPKSYFNWATTTFVMPIKFLTMPMSEFETIIQININVYYKIVIKNGQIRIKMENGVNWGMLTCDECVPQIQINTWYTMAIITTHKYDTAENLITIQMVELYSDKVYTSTWHNDGIEPIENYAYRDPNGTPLIPSTRGFIVGTSEVFGISGTRDASYYVSFINIYKGSATLNRHCRSSAGKMADEMCLNYVGWSHQLSESRGDCIHCPAKMAANDLSVTRYLNLMPEGKVLKRKRQRASFFCNGGIFGTVIHDQGTNYIMTGGCQTGEFGANCLECSSNRRCRQCGYNGDPDKCLSCRDSNYFDFATLECPTCATGCSNCSDPTPNSCRSNDLTGGSSGPDGFSIMSYATPMGPY